MLQWPTPRSVSKRQTRETKPRRNPETEEFVTSVSGFYVAEIMMMRGSGLKFGLVNHLVGRNIYDGKLAVDGHIERDDGLCALKSERLQLVVDNVEQVVIVEGIDFDEHIESARGVMTFHHLRDFLESLNHFVEVTGIFQVKTNVCTRLIADFLRIDNELRAFDDSEMGEFLNALMNGGSAAKADNRWEARLKIEITFGIDLTGASWERDYGLNKRAAGTL